MRRRRRQVLSALALSAASFAGCSAPGASGTDDGTTTDTATRTATSEPSATDSPTTDPTSTEAVTPDPDDPIAVVLYNETDETLTVTVTVTRSGTDFFDETRSVAPDDEPTLDTGIRETGSYELTVAVEGGPSETVPLDIERYDVRMGSNLIVEIGSDDILILIEE